MPDNISILREEYFDKFKELLNFSEGKYVLNLRGIGGRGKTKILSHIEAFCEENKYPCIFVDFFHSELNNQINKVEQAIVESIRKQFEVLDIDSLKPFTSYEKARSEAEDARKKGESRYGILRAQAKEAFISDLSQCMEIVCQFKKKCVFLFDTFELVQYKAVGLRLLKEWLPGLKSAVVVLSGRQLQGTLEELLSKELLPVVSDLAVGEFTEKEAIDYLRQRNVFDEIGEYIDLILKLSERHPLRLALVADRLHMHPKIEVEQLIAYVKEDFEKDIVQSLYREAQQPESLVFPIIAHIHEPLNHELMGVLFDPVQLPSSPDAILEDLTKYSFIKKTVDNGITKYWFQDEVRSLFHRYIFNGNDELGANSLRIDTSKKMIEFYDKKISLLPSSVDQQEIKYLLEAEKSYYEVFLTHSKFDELMNKFQKLREMFNIRYANIIFGAIQACGEFLQDKHSQYRIRLAQTRSLRDNDYSETSAQLLEKLLDSYKEIPERAVYVYNALGGTYEHLGKLKDARMCYEKSFELRQQLGDVKKLWLERFNIARVLRESGSWHKSRDYFEEAYNYVLEYGESKHNEADVLFEFGHSYGLLGEYDPNVGLEYCVDAIQLWEEQSEKEDISDLLAIKKSCIANIFYGTHGDCERALKEIDNAILKLTGETYNPRTMAQVYLDRGFVLLMQSTKVKESSVLEEAKVYFNLSIDIARELVLNKILVAALHESSHVCWWLGEKEIARKNNEESLEIAKAINNGYYIINCLVGTAEFDFDERKFDSIAELVNEIQSYKKDYQFPHFYGRMKRIMGDIEMLHKNTGQAFEHYADALPELAVDDNFFSLYGLEDGFTKLEQQLLAIDSIQERIKYCEFLKERWRTEKLETRTISKLLRWINKLLGQYKRQP
jgi:tetratricopeptide (TPR) repeat protein